MIIVTFIFAVFLMYHRMSECSASILTRPHHASFDKLRRGIKRTDHFKHVPSNCNLGYKCSLSMLLDMRGGDDGTIGTSEDADNKHMIGIVDVRSNTEADCIILAQAQKDDVQFLDVASFLATSEESVTMEAIADDTTPEEVQQNQAAAAALTIGSSCPTIYLLLTYDFKEGKTVLHRSLGGIKLMSLVDGVRKRWSESASKTKLILLLASSNDGEVGESIVDGFTGKTTRDLSQDTEWKKEGVIYLIDRVKQYFELGGDEFNGVDPFEELSTIFTSITPQQSDANGMLGIVKSHSQQYLNDVSDTAISSSDEDHFKLTIKDRFESFGGIGDPAFL